MAMTHPMLRHPATDPAQIHLPGKAAASSLLHCSQQAQLPSGTPGHRMCTESDTSLKTLPLIPSDVHLMSNSCLLSAGNDWQTVFLEGMTHHHTVLSLPQNPSAL